MLTFLHAADFHLDSPFAALTPEEAAARRAEQRGLLDRLADLAAARRADLVLLAGDLFDSETVFPETAAALAARLGEIGAPVFIAPGNHDCFTPRSVYARTAWPENVHIFESAVLTGCEIPGKNAVVHGAAFTAPVCEASLLARFSAPEDGRIHIGLLHGTAGESAGQYDPIPREDIEKSGLDYLALGHIHQRAEAQRAGGTVYAWPGCPEGRGFDETGVRGVYVGTVDAGAVSLEFVPLCARRYEILTVDISDAEAEAAVRAALPPDAQRHILRVILTGEPERAPDTAALAAALAGACYHLQLRDATRLRRGVWDRAGEDTLSGLFLRALRRRYDEAGDEETRAHVTRAARAGLAALEGREART